VALSTTETEYIAVCMGVCEAVWLQKLLARLSDQILDPTVIHYIRDMVQRKIVLVEFTPSSHISNTRVIRVNKYRKTIISNVFFTRVNPSISQKGAPSKYILFPFHDFS
jgi:hypothetical protein